jgi:hypothetical protein
MKRTFVILTLFVCCFASRASDQMFYGPWWTTLLLSSGGAKPVLESLRSTRRKAMGKIAVQ